MTNEELAPLHKDKNGNNEPVFWIDEQHEKGGSVDNKDVSTEAQHGLAGLSRAELERLAAQLAISSPTRPPEEGSDTYLG